MNKNVLLFYLFLIIVNIANAQQIIEMPVWPNGTKESNGITRLEEEGDGGRVRYVSIASLEVHFPDNDKAKETAILICPGGGYTKESTFHEGTLFAKWCAEHGVTAIVLKYRLPNGHHAIPLKDVQEAIRIIRRNVVAWKIDPNKIGVSGFSAGGHLASTLLVHSDEMSHPNFGILFYPVITMDNKMPVHHSSKRNLLGKDYDIDKIADFYSTEKHIKNETPPTLLILCDDDDVVSPLNSLLFYQGLKFNNIPASLYVFPKGGHGWGFNKDFYYHECLKTIILDWLQQRNFIKL